MFSTKLSLLLLSSLAAAPAIASARPDFARDGALTDEVRKTHGSQRARAPQSERKGGLCQVLDCTAEQREAIRTIRHETRERLRAERSEAHAKAEIDRILAGGIGRIGAVLDEQQRAELERLVAAHGPKIAFGGGLHAKHNGEREPAAKAEHPDRDPEKRAAAAEKRLAKAENRVAKAENRVVTAKKRVARAEKRVAKGHGKSARRFTAKPRHSAKA